jgi:hypothetical protein|tara:strand:+ start:2546 stop:2962 length:417 start_codon:yes stop_codon:yes gene_type:complete
MKNYFSIKIIKYFIISFFVLTIVDGQEIKKDGKTPKTFTYDEALEMLKARDAQWESKLSKADSLIESQKVTISDCETLVVKLEEQTNVDSLMLVAQKKQIGLLKSRDEANEKLVKLVEPKWYENQYLWLVIGFIFGKL